MRLILQLLSLTALMLMPFGMTPVAATPQRHAAFIAMEHCPEQGSRHEKGAFVECTMACSAALPAADRPHSTIVPIDCERLRPTLARHLSDLHPEIATPPPKTPENSKFRSSNSGD